MRNSTILSIALLFLLAVNGCSSLMDKRTESEIRRDNIRKQLESESRPILVKQLATQRQLGFAQIKNLALITNLSDTGGPVSPSQQRERILDMLRRNEVPNPNALLDSKKTAMVLVDSRIPPAAKAGERFNVNVELSKHSQATDLSQGWLREVPLVEIAQFEGRPRTSFDFAKAEGSLVTYAQYTGSKEEQHKLQAVVVGGAKLLKSRELGIGIDEEFSDAITMATVVPAINARFTYFDGSSQKGVAVPQSDDHIDLHLPARYKLQPDHFVQVVLRISFNEPPEQRAKRIEKLTGDITNPATVREACWQLEAIGESAADILASQVGNPNDEIQFYCAQSLAYLGDKRSIQALKDLAYRQAAFRALSLNALACLDNYQSEEALRSLLHCDDPETRYGAVRALRHRNPRDPIISAHQIPRLGGLLEIPTSGPELVAVSMHETPEIVVFGQTPILTLPPFHNVNLNILLQRTSSNEVTITRFAPDKEDVVSRCPPDLLSVLNSISQVGGGYGDWVNFIRECKELGFISTPIAMNPVPITGRAFDRENGTSSIEVEPPKVDEVETTDPTTITAWYKPWTWWK